MGGGSVHGEVPGTAAATASATHIDLEHEALSRHELRGLVRQMQQADDPERIIDDLAAAICGGWQCSHPVVVRHDVGRDAFVTRPAAREAHAFAANHPLVCTLSRRGAVITASELANSEEQDDEDAARACREHGWDVCVPLPAGDRLVAFVAFRRLGAPPLTVVDLERLERLAYAGGAAIAHAEARQELGLAREAIRRSERLSALGTLAASVAHEIRNQMVAIQTFVQLLPTRLDDPEFLTSFHDLANDEVKRIAALVGELLAFARANDDGIDREDVNHLVERTVTLLEPEAKRHQVELRCQLDAELPELFGSGDKIRQVLANLVLNGIQATAPGGSVTLCTRNAGGRVCIDIHDTGAGIAADKIDQIFLPFFTTKADGTGLGLGIARHIVREHNGEIHVASEEGRGTTFVVELPAAP